jgi:predicted DNA-binding transcriptional regulator AlpA
MSRVAIPPPGVFPGDAKPARGEGPPRPEGDGQEQGPQKTPPLLIPAPEAARLSGVSPATWHRLAAAKKVPAPVRLGGRVLWRAAELREWIAAGCPDRRTWEARRGKE